MASILYSLSTGNDLYTATVSWYARVRVRGRARAYSTGSVSQSAAGFRTSSRMSLRSIVEAGGLTMEHVVYMQVYLHKQPVNLTQRELRLLSKFMYSPRQIFTTAQLEIAMSGHDTELESNALNVHIYHLRRKLGADVIDTVRGLGYRLGAGLSTDNTVQPV